jgi:hypothetical protein
LRTKCFRRILGQREKNGRLEKGVYWLLILIFRTTPLMLLLRLSQGGRDGTVRINAVKWFIWKPTEKRQAGRWEVNIIMGLYYLKYDDFEWNHLIWMCTYCICMNVFDDDVLQKWFKLLHVAEKDFIDQSLSFSNPQIMTSPLSL